MATGYKSYKTGISLNLKAITEILKDQKQFSVGVVTTVPFNHATSAAFLSHNNKRTHYYTGYKDYVGIGIADEIIKKAKPEVVIGGGHPMDNNVKFNKKKGYISKALYDDLRFSKDYVLAERSLNSDGNRILRTKAQEALKRGKRLFGLFGGFEGKLSPPELSDDGTPGLIRKDLRDPEFDEAIIIALDVLSSNKKGFFLLIEQGDIDWANHKNDYRSMITGMLQLNQAVIKILNYIEKPGDEINWDNTLVIVTSDHVTGGMRLKRTMGKGVLPKQYEILPILNNGKKYFYPPGEVEYLSTRHTNELMTIYSIGCCTELFNKHENKWYPGTRIIDNTHIFMVMKEAAGL